MNPRHRGILLVALLLLEGAVWVEPAGSWLAEPDEARYAEIPREMLASRDFVTPKLNGVPYLEKPPLLYWANAASLRLFGLTPWAARLPTRLFGLGTVLTLLFGTAAIWGERQGAALHVSIQEGRRNGNWLRPLKVALGLVVIESRGSTDG